MEICFDFVFHLFLPRAAIFLFHSLLSSQRLFQKSPVEQWTHTTMIFSFFFLSLLLFFFSSNTISLIGFAFPLRRQQLLSSFSFKLFLIWVLPHETGVWVAEERKRKKKLSIFFSGFIFFVPFHCKKKKFILRCLPRTKGRRKRRNKVPDVWQFEIMKVLKSSERS